MVCTEYCSIHASSELIPTTARIPNDALWAALDQRREELEWRGLRSLQRIGDCRAPRMIAAAVYAGYKAARELGEQLPDFRRDRVLA